MKHLFCIKQYMYIPVLGQRLKTIITLTNNLTHTIFYDKLKPLNIETNQLLKPL